jgi:hypothetical protein
MRVASPFSVWLKSPWRRATPAVKRTIVIGAVFGILIYLGAHPGRDLFFRATGIVKLSGSGRQPPRPAEARDMGGRSGSVRPVPGCAGCRSAGAGQRHDAGVPQVAAL